MKILWLSCVLVWTSCFGCTDLLLSSKDGASVVGRSMEFAENLQSRVFAAPKDANFASSAPNRQQGLAWTSKYDYMGITVFDSIVVDGFNDQGLSVGLLWFPGAKYPDVTREPSSNTLSFADLGDYLLGTCATTAEAKAALQRVAVYSYVLPQFAGIPPVHLSIHDGKGESAVVEFLNGQVVISDNPVGVLTNAPEFTWHLTNLRNYLNLTAINAGEATFDNTVLQPTGQGTGLLGIPGDWTPPSRFVRMALFKNFIADPANASAAVNSAIHLLNTVDIPFGDVRESKSAFDYTQWIVVKDLTNRRLYLRTYLNPSIQVFELPKAMKGRQFLTKVLDEQ